MQKPLENYAFIDSQNVNLSIRAQGWKLDWARFRVYLKEKYAVKKAFLFIGYIEGNNELYTSLQLERDKLEAVLIPNKHKYSALLRFKAFRRSLRLMNELKERLEYKPEKKRPQKD